MSALAMILTAAMIPGDGQEKMAGEIEQRLDLRGQWEGEWKSGGVDSDHPLRVKLKNGVLVAKGDNSDRPDKIKLTKVTDEGNGKVRFTLGIESCVGIYCQEADCLSICFSVVPHDRPTTFRPRAYQWLFILHRLKSRK